MQDMVNVQTCKQKKIPGTALTVSRNSFSKFPKKWVCFKNCDRVCLFDCNLLLENHKYWTTLKNRVSNILRIVIS